jgi:hypothetical protein
MLAIGVEVKAVIMTSPDRGYIFRLFEYRYLDSCGAHGHGGGQPRRASPHNDRVGFRQWTLTDAVRTIGRIAPTMASSGWSQVRLPTPASSGIGSACAALVQLHVARR